ncbi:MAG: hypothetical protein AB8E82_10970 [Aureispira sp.]
MTASELASTVQPLFDNWYKNLKKHLQTGVISSPNTIYCQDVVQLYETDKYLALELTGQQPLSTFKSISFGKKIKKLSTINSIINGGSVIKEPTNYQPRIEVANPGEIWANLNIASYDAYNNDTKSLNIAKLQEGLAGTPSIPIQVKSNAGGLLLANSTIMRLEAPKLFVRQIGLFLLVDKATDPIRLVHFLIERLNDTFPKRDRFVGIDDDELQINNPLRQLVGNKAPVLPDFLTQYGHRIAHALGYQAAKANVPLADGSTIDLLLEKEDGSHDLFNLTEGLFSQKNTKGKKNKPNLSNTMLALKAQWQQATQEQNQLQLAQQPLLIGVVQNSNQVYQQGINKAATEATGQVALLSLEGLCILMELWMKEQG